MDGADRNPAKGGADVEAAFAAQGARLAAALMALEARLAPGAAAPEGDLNGDGDDAEHCARLRASNERLREICADLRDGAGAAAVDAAMAAEVEAMEAQRAAERAELDRLIRILSEIVEAPA